MHINVLFSGSSLENIYIINSLWIIKHVVCVCVCVCVCLCVWVCEYQQMASAKLQKKLLCFSKTATKSNPKDYLKIIVQDRYMIKDPVCTSVNILLIKQLPILLLSVRESG